MIKNLNLIKIGLRIRKIRKEKNLSLQDIADRGNLSKSLISKVENFRTIPSLPVLSRIADALRVDIAEIVKGINEKQKHPYAVVKKEGREIMKRESAKGFVYESLITQNTASSLFESFVLTLKKGAERKPVSTDGDEFLLMLKGKIEFHYGKEKIVLEEGDSMFFNGRIPHVPENIGECEAKFLAIYLLK